MTSFRTLSQRGGEVHPPDERGSMAILLMVVLVGLMLSALLVPMIITQSRNTRFDSTRLQALNAAQSGIDVTLGAIRASVVERHRCQQPASVRTRIRYGWIAPA